MSMVNRRDALSAGHCWIAGHNFVCQEFVAKLSLKRNSANVVISGIDGAITTSNQIVCLNRQSRLNSYLIDIECIVTEQVTS